MCLVAWPLNESEAGGDLVLTETLVLFISKFLLISMRTASLTWEKQGVEVSIKTRSPPASLSFKGQATKQETVKWSILGYNTGFISKLNTSGKMTIKPDTETKKGSTFPQLLPCHSLWDPNYNDESCRKLYEIHSQFKQKAERLSECKPRQI